MAGSAQALRSNARVATSSPYNERHNLDSNGNAAISSGLNNLNNSCTRQSVMHDSALVTEQSPKSPKMSTTMVPRIQGQNQINGLSGGQKKKVIECPHTDKRYYAKGMCVNCYHRRGRTKKAWKCAHTRKMHYSKGLCKFCYLASYYKSRTSG